MWAADNGASNWTIPQLHTSFLLCSVWPTHNSSKFTWSHMAVTANWKVTWQCKFALYDHFSRVSQLWSSCSRCICYSNASHKITGNWKWSSLNIKWKKKNYLWNIHPLQLWLADCRILWFFQFSLTWRNSRASYSRCGAWALGFYTSLFHVESRVSSVTGKYRH